MGKKGKEQGPVPNLAGVQNRDIIQRINFLYQASSYLGSISPAANQEDLVPEGKNKKKNALRHPKSAAELSRSYVGTMRLVGQKTMVRMDPSIKRTLCKRCDTVLAPGTTASVRVKPSRVHGQAVVYTCLSCNTLRRIPAPQVLGQDVKPTETPTTATNTAPSTSAIALAPAAPIHNSDTEVVSMDVDPAPALVTNRLGIIRRPKKHRKAVARDPPFFERKGHVIFKGNEVFVEP